MRRRFPLLFVIVALCRAHFDGAGCGTEKECLFVPPGCQTHNVCKHIFSYWSKGDGYVDMEIYTREYTPGTNYLAVGFSNDDLMGDDAVTQCGFPEQGNAEAHVSFNFGKSNQPPQEPEDKEAEKTQIELVHASKDEESMYCHLRQKIEAGPSAYYPALDKDHTLFIARGKGRKPDLLGIHSLDPSSPDFPHISPQKHNLGKRMANATPKAAAPAPPSSESSGLSKETRFWLVKVHGMIMLFAWLFCVPVAVFAARYFRDHWPGSAPLGLKWWFHLHRSFNVLALIFVLVSAFIIFLAKDFSWTGPVAGYPSEQNWSAGSIHSLFGLIAAIVVIINPLMALFRCAPDTGARPIFNWSHRVIGILGFICAMVAVFYATNSFTSLWSDHLWAFSLYLFFLVLLILATIIFEVLDWLKTRTEHKVHHMEMRGRYDDQGRVITSTKVLHRRPMHATTALWILFALASLGLVITLIIMLIV